ncbi:MAG: chemotaxis protein CheY [Planctomycetes bacterium SM23_32]|nr:MAG: chemotaxis protein CheY [Planctomycetes bacterium SM23_32]
MPTVLLVEDEDNVRLLYQQELEERGYEVICAADGKAAVELAQRAAPDVVIMDINLPEKMDGIESMSRILSQNKDIPVIINTGYSEYQDNFMSWAADAYILKSSDVGPLIDAVEDALRRRASSQPD